MAVVTFEMVGRTQIKRLMMSWCFSVADDVCECTNLVRLALLIGGHEYMILNVA